MRSTLMFMLRALLAALGLRDAADMKPLRIGRGRRPYWLYADGTILPRIAGADGADDDEDDDDNDGDDDSDDNSDDEDEDDAEDDDDSDDEDEDDDVDEDELPDKVKAILKKERKARRTAEKEARRAKRNARSRGRDDDEDDDDEDDDDSRGKRGRGRRKERETRSDEPDAGTVKLRRANLITALTEEGYTGKKAKALEKLIGGDVEYDDDDEPENLKDALEEAEDTYGKSLVGKPKRRAGKSGGRSGGDGGERPSLTADEQEAAKAFGMTDAEYAEFKKPNPTLPPKKKKSDD